MDAEFERLTQAAENGDAEAQYKLGEIYNKGTYYLDRDKSKAEYWLTKAADQDHKYALLSLISFFTNEPEKAQYWFKRNTEACTRECIRKEHEKSSSGGCYVATCVYGSYDCPEVWTFRQFRDNTLKNSWLGRMFIRVYYATSPKVVELFGDNKLFRKMCKSVLDKILARLS